MERGQNETKRRSAIGIYAAMFLIGAFLLANPPEPEVCALCGNGEGRPYHAPCVLEPSTGLLAELAVYAPEPACPGELAPEQDLDHHVFRAACGGRITLSVDRSPTLQRCTAYVPKTAARPNLGLYCRACRKLLAGAERAYVLVDLSHVNHITVYPIAADAACQIRDYTVSVFEAGEQYEIEVTAALF
nr:hypothetical protein [uncultured Oscillibacter sp.]